MAFDPKKIQTNNQKCINFLAHNKFVEIYKKKMNIVWDKLGTLKKKGKDAKKNLWLSAMILKLEHYK